MLKTREAVSKRIQSICKKNFRYPEKLQNYKDMLETQFNIPGGMAADLLTLKVRPEDMSDYIMFALLKVLDETEIRTTFTDSEIKTYSITKFKQKKIKFPIKWQMSEVVEGQQWIGTIKLNELMELRNASLVRYNENTQRTMKKIIDGDTSYWEISLDRKTVNDIKEAIANGTYVPTTLTFNIPEDGQFYYKDGYLFIKEISFLDIIDGYHRYIALSKIYDLDPKFEFNMEIRVVSFSESKAKQFIWQEDQKTKMRKIDSESLNQTNPATKIVEQINSDSRFLLAGKISRSGGLINLGDFTQVVGDIYYQTQKKKQLNRSTEISYMLNVKNQLIDGLNNIIEIDVDSASKEWSYKRMVAYVYGIYANKESKEIVEKAEELDDSLLPKTKILSTNAITRIGKEF